MNYVSICSTAWTRAMCLIFWATLQQAKKVISEMLPSGKHTKNDGKSQFLMGKSTITMAYYGHFQ